MIFVLDTSTENTFMGLWYDKWLAENRFVGGRELNAKLFTELDKTFRQSGEYKKVSEAIRQVTGIVVASGPGSFTGLRIGLSVANTLAYSLDVPIVGIQDETDPEKLLQKGLSVLKSRGASFGEVVVPHYGAEPHITKPKG